MPHDTHKETAPMMVAAFGDLAGKVMAIVKATPEALPILFRAPPADFHCYVTYLRKAKVEPPVAGRAILGFPARRLLRLATKYAHDVARLHGAFAKLPARQPLSECDYERLFALFKDAQVFAPVIDRLTSLTADSIESLDAIRRHGLTETLLLDAAGALVDACSSIIAELATAFAVLRANRLIDPQDQAFLDAIRGATRPSQLFAIIGEKLAPLEVGTLGPVLAAAPRFSPARSFADLRALAARYDGWSPFHSRIIATALHGATVVGEYADPESSTFIVRLDVLSRGAAGTVVSIAGTQGLDEEDAPPEAIARLVAELGAVPGLFVVEAPLAPLITHVFKASKDDGKDGETDHEETNDEFDDDHWARIEDAFDGIDEALALAHAA